MTESKQFFKSKTLWAGGLLMLSALAGFLGTLLQNGDLVSSADPFKETFLVGLGLVGLRTANKKIA